MWSSTSSDISYILMVLLNPAIRRGQMHDYREAIKGNCYFSSERWRNSRSNIMCDLCEI